MHNSNCVSLSLYENKISDIGALAIQSALKANKTLTSLDLADNHISAKIIVSINGLIDLNKKRNVKDPKK